MTRQFIPATIDAIERADGRKLNGIGFNELHMQLHGEYLLAVYNDIKNDMATTIENPGEWYNYNDNLRSGKIVHVAFYAIPTDEWKKKK